MPLPDLNTIEMLAEDIVLFGGAFMALLYGLKRMYTTARNVEKLVEASEKMEESNKKYREEVRKDLEVHTEREAERNAMRDAKLDTLNIALTELANDLRAHVKMEEDRDLIRDQQLIQLTDHMDEIIAEMRPNGGSSMKDILSKASAKVDEVHTRVAVLEQWKEDKVDLLKPKKVRRMVRRTGRK